MALPLFYISRFDGIEHLMLTEDASRHIVQVLRMDAGEKLELVDGKGKKITAQITEPHKKHCGVTILAVKENPKPERHITIAISLLKNTDRFEWFLEKATEIGVSEIIPLICERTEKEKFRWDRMNAICISAMMQSQQYWLPILHEPKKFEEIKMWKCDNGTNYIAHCLEGAKNQFSHSQISTSTHSLICIGPEGDFTSKEIELASQNNFLPISLGETRLRAETAGVVAATMLVLG